MNIAKFCIRHKVTTLLAVIMIAVFGVVYTTQLQMALLPNIEYPAAYVYCYYNGAGPEDIEQLVTRPLESAIMSVPGVDSVTSSSADSISTIQIMYVENTDVDIAATKLREKFDALSLPDGCGSPVILNINVSEMMPSAIVGLLGDDLAALQQQAENVVAPALERIDGVASVSVSGGVERQITVTLDAQRAAGYGLSTSYITQILQAENLLYPAGEVYNGSQKISVTTDAQLSTVDEVANINIPLQTGGTVRLGEVADVAFETSDRDAIAAMDGTPGIILQVSKRSGANEVKTAEAVVAAMEELAAKDGSIHYAIPYVASEYINVAVDAALEGIILGVVLAALVVWLFLRRGGATMTIAVSMPVCILAVFVLMYVCDLTLNMMSLGGIAMGVGMIVDNSIIVLENIYRWASEGHDRMTSCVEGTKEVTLSLTASTLTTVAVFLPLGLTGGIAGQIFKDFCLTIAFLILGSLAVAVTLVPLLCYFLLDESKVHLDALQRAQKGGRRAQKLMDWYVKKLDYYVHHLKRGVLVSVALVAVFLAACLNTKMVLLPEMDEGMVTVTVSMPIGSKVEQAAAMAERVAAIAEETIPELASYYYTADSGQSASLVLNLTDKGERDRSATDIANALRDATYDVAGCEITCSAYDMGAMMGSSTSMLSMGSGESHDVTVYVTLADDEASGAAVGKQIEEACADLACEVTTSSAMMDMSMLTGSGVSVNVYCDDMDTLQSAAAQVGKALADIPGVAEVSDGLEDASPALHVAIDRNAAMKHGLTVAQIYMELASALTDNATAATLELDGVSTDVIIEKPEGAVLDVDSLRGYVFEVTKQDGTVEEVPLSDFAEVRETSSLGSIHRLNQRRYLSVTATLEEGYNVTLITAKAQDVVGALDLGDGVSYTFTGENETIMEAVQQLLLMLVLGILLVYLVMVAQFQSLKSPFIVMFTIPLAFTGGFMALLLCGMEISVISLIGFVMLTGIIVNNGIVLVDYINQLRQDGMERRAAIEEAGVTRMRPILMTTITTVLGLVDMAVHKTAGTSLMKPVAIVCIGGLVYATLMTLFVVPCIYDMLNKKELRSVREEDLKLLDL